jgi:hypothetical protein
MSIAIAVPAAKSEDFRVFRQAIGSRDLADHVWKATTLWRSPHRWRQACRRRVVIERDAVAARETETAET